MRNLLAKREYTCEVPHARLENVWCIEADKSYSVSRNRKGDDIALVALRTLSGVGRLTTYGGGNYELITDSLLIVRASDITGYFAAQDGWHFYWFEFVMDTEPAHMGEVMMLNVSEHERIGLERCFISLGSVGECECRLAESLFNFMLAEWMMHAQRADDGGRPGINIIMLLERGRREKLNITEMAREAGMCERSFRDAARAATGLSPKSFMLKGEMTAAMEMLRSSSMSIAEIATCFNYSSQFYFSRVFKKYYGISPQQVRGGIDE